MKVLMLAGLLLAATDTDSSLKQIRDAMFKAYSDVIDCIDHNETKAEIKKCSDKVTNEMVIKIQTAISKTKE